MAYNVLDCYLWLLVLLAVYLAAHITFTKATRGSMTGKPSIKPNLQMAIVMLAMLLFASPLMAERIIGVGLHLGGQHNTGNIDSFYQYAQADPQNSMFVGVAFKFSAPFAFLRTGVDNSFAINKGNVLEDQSISGAHTNEGLDTYQLSYTAIPAFVGLQFPLQDKGVFYLGGGIAYFLGTGKVKSEASGTSEDISATALAFGFISGMQLHLTRKISLYMEWEYLEGRSKPVAQTDSLSTYENFYVDYTGHRLQLGLMYFVL